MNAPASPFPSTPASDSLAGTANALPYEYYERMREKGEVVWDEGMKAWVVTSIDAARHVLRNDKVLFNHGLQELDRDMVSVIAGGENIVMMTGERHTKMHQWFIKALSPPTIEKWRSALIKPVAAHLVDRFAARKDADGMRPPDAPVFAPWECAWGTPSACMVGNSAPPASLRAPEDRDDRDTIPS